MHRLTWWISRQTERLGVVGIVLLLVLVSTVVFYSVVYRPQRQTLAAMQLPRQPQLVVTPSVTPEDQLLAFIAHFPSVTKRSDSVNTLFSLAAKQSINLDEISYKLEHRQEDALAHYHVDFNIVAPYPRTRQYLNALLIALPHASLDTVSMHRESVTSTDVETRVRLTLHFAAS